MGWVDKMLKIVRKQHQVYAFQIVLCPSFEALSSIKYCPASGRKDGGLTWKKNLRVSVNSAIFVEVLANY